MPRPFWTRYLSPQDRTPKGAPGKGEVRTLRYPSDEAEVPDPKKHEEETEQVWTMRFPSDEAEVPEPRSKDKPPPPQ